MTSLRRALQNPLKTECRLDVGFVVLVASDARRRILDELLELAAQPAEIGAASLQHFDDLRNVQEGEQQVLHRDEFVPFFTRSLKRVVEAIFELVRKH